LCNWLDTFVPDKYNSDSPEIIMTRGWCYLRPVSKIGQTRCMYERRSRHVIWRPFDICLSWLGKLYRSG